MDLSIFLKIFKINFGQILRYGIIGIALNGCGFFVYIFFTYNGFNPVKVVAILYPISVIIGYCFHTVFSFKGKNIIYDLSQFLRFCFTHIVGYLINILLLFFFHVHLGFSHAPVQLTLILIVAVFLFISQKLFVYGKR